MNNYWYVPIEENRRGFQFHTRPAENVVLPAMSSRYSICEKMLNKKPYNQSMLLKYIHALVLHGIICVLILYKVSYFQFLLTF